MKFFKVTLFFIFLAAVPVHSFAGDQGCGHTKPINSINEMFIALDSCWQPPKGTTGMSITLRFSLRNDGSLIGKPQTTYTRQITDNELSKAFVASILEALDKVLPLPFTKSMGGAVAGRPISLRFIAQEGRGL